MSFLRKMYLLLLLVLFNVCFPALFSEAVDRNDLLYGEILGNRLVEPTPVSREQAVRELGNPQYHIIVIITYVAQVGFAPAFSAYEADVRLLHYRAVRVIRLWRGVSREKIAPTIRSLTSKSEPL